MIVPKPKTVPIAAAETQNNDDEIQIIGSTGKNALSGTKLNNYFYLLTSTMTEPDF